MSTLKGTVYLTLRPRRQWTRGNFVVEHVSVGIPPLNVQPGRLTVPIHLEIPQRLFEQQTELIKLSLPEPPPAAARLIQGAD